MNKYSFTIEFTDYNCKSVPAGWQTEIWSEETQSQLVGPVFNDIEDLWRWQQSHIEKDYDF